MRMNKNPVIIIVSANLFILVLLALFVPNLMIAPGQPIDAHAELATDCFACHSPLVGSTARKCISCHKVSEIGLKTTKGVTIASEKKNVAFHQSLVEEDCIACHSDHKGVKPFRPISQFSHRLLDSTLQKQCDGCHDNPGDALHQKIKGNCNQCHSEDSWTPATFDHNDYFRFDRDHDTECETCHIENSYADYTCYGCHEHSRSEVREEHYEEGIRDYEVCVDCHRSADEDEAERIWRSRDFGSEKSRSEGTSINNRGKYEHDDDDD